MPTLDWARCSVAWICRSAACNGWSRPARQCHWLAHFPDWSEASKTAAGYQARLRDLAIRNGLDVGREPALASLIQDSASQSGLGRTATLDMLEHLNATGMGFAAAQMNLGLAGRFGFGQGIASAEAAGWFERCNWPRVRTRQSNCPPPSTAWSSWVKAESAVRPWRVACLPCCQRWAMRERPRPAMSVHWGLAGDSGKEHHARQSGRADEGLAEFVSSGSLKRAYGQDYDRDLEALRKDGASLLEANLELAARYRDKGGKLSAGGVAGA